MEITRIVSGGQTGADRAALDAALERGVPCGGWCPRGRRAEDGPIPDCYPLEETDSIHYPPRTALNIRRSDGALVLTCGRPDRGSRLTVRLCGEYGKPCLSVDLASPPSRAGALEAIRGWMAAHQVRELNVAGPTERGSPGIHAEAWRLMRQLLAARP